MLTRLVGLGAGGHARVVLDILRQDPRLEVVGLLDPGRVGQTVAGVPVLGGDELLGELRSAGVSAAFIGVGGVGGVGGLDVHALLFERARAAGFQVITAVHPAAVVAASAMLGEGTVVMAGSVINPDAWIGANVIVNTHAVVEHDCRVGDHSHIAPGAILSGGAQVGRSAHIGAGATVLQYRSVGDEAVVGAGAVVVHDVAPGARVAGVPARPMTARPAVQEPA